MSHYTLRGHPGSYWEGHNGSSRDGRHVSTADFTGAIDLTRVRVNGQGYTPRGQYYGTGAPIFEWSIYDLDIEGSGFRARDRKAAKDKIRLDFPRAKIR